MSSSDCKIKNIRFSFNNETDKKIYDYFEEHKRPKFSTLVKDLLLEYIDNADNNNINKNSYSNVKTNNDVKLSKTEIINLINDVIKQYDNENKKILSDSNLNINSDLNEKEVAKEKVEIEKTVKDEVPENTQKHDINPGKTNKKGKKIRKNLLSQIQSFEEED